MATLYGALVGALIQAGKGFAGVSNRFKDGSDDILIRDTVALTTANLIGDVIVLGTFKSNAYIDPAATLWNDALGASVTLNIGDSVHPTGLASALAVTNAGNAAIHKAFTPVMMGYPLWQKLGYSADPGGFLTLQAVIAGANIATPGSLAWKIVGKNS